MTDTIHMEGYPHPLRKQKIYVIGETSVLDTYFQSIFQTYSDELLHRHKVVVIFSDAYIKHQPRWCKEIFSDAVFRVRDNQDLRLAATYIQHTSKPLCVIWYSSDIPSVMVQNLLQSKDDITFITGGTNIVKQDYTSVFWNTKTSYDETTVNTIRDRYNLSFDNDSVNELYKTFPHPLKNEPTGTFDTISSWTDSQIESYKNAYFYVCTETYAHGLYKSLTEKICKPMVNFMPFVFMSFPGALALLRSLGFKTFSPFIDESYDDEPDESIRLNMIYKEIYRLSQMPKEEIHAWYWQMKDILIHNNNRVLNFYKEDQLTPKLVKYLHKKIS